MPLLIVAVIVALVTSAIAQTTAPSAATEFEVASIKPNNSDTLPPLNAVSLTMLRLAATYARNGRYTKQGIGATTLSILIQAAYDVRDFQILGAPGWVGSDRYDVDARAPDGTTFEQMRPMLQSLLADRFKLTLRHQTRQLPVYELAPARNGLKIAPMKEGSCTPKDQAIPFGPIPCDGLRRQIVSLAPERKDVIEAVGVPMQTLIDFLTEESGRIVLDKTGFTELFNFRLEFASNLASGFLNGDTAAASSPSGISIFTAVEEQLGLRLRSTIGPVEVLVINRVKSASPN